jgi:hypothetical protein
MTRPCALLLAGLLLFLPAARGQRSPNPKLAPIQDNSFLIEEAYNQEDGVIQHIHTFSRMSNSQDWLYTFTEEWPVPGRPRHQISYTMTAAHAGGFPGAGVGDFAMNYRYQLVGNGETKVALAPRLSLLLPTGSADHGRGAGGFGWQTNLPLSVAWNSRIVTHWNLGATVVPSARDAAGDHGFSSSYNAGGSVVWLTQSRFNVLVETLFTRGQSVTGPAKTPWSDSLLLSPGLRWAFNFKSGLQIVPGVAAPIGVGPSAGEKGVFLYLSFEHPFRWATTTRR